MKAVIQRVQWAKVEVGGKVVGEISRGLLTLLGIEKSDTQQTIERGISKILKLRIFESQVDPEKLDVALMASSVVSKKMDYSLLDLNTHGLKVGHLIVSQFTLLGDLSQGNRPSFMAAAQPEQARVLYDYAIKWSHSQGIFTQGGQFQAEMAVSLLNDGPVTLIFS